MSMSLRDVPRGRHIRPPQRSDETAAGCVRQVFTQPVGQPFYRRRVGHKITEPIEISLRRIEERTKSLTGCHSLFMVAIARTVSLNLLPALQLLTSATFGVLPLPIRNRNRIDRIPLLAQRRMPLGRREIGRAHV